ncbi:hypothetical protein HK405_010176 [Cladochytrium tenue]|nr:hypothetical protein HK405_010176 [Cladochytrium tenue]
MPHPSTSAAEAIYTAPGAGGGSPATRRPSLVRAVVASAVAAEEALRRETASGASRPPLNLLTTTPYNMTRMVARLGPVVDTVDELRALLAWKRPLLSLLAAVAYAAVCLFPVVLLLLPQAVLLAAIAHSYYFPHRPVRLAAAAGSAATDGTVAVNSTDSTAAASVGKAQYARNLQFLQNFMGVYCDAYDASAALLAAALDWSDPRLPTLLLQVAALAIPAALVAYALLPVNSVCLVAGLVAFARHTAAWERLVRPAAASAIERIPAKLLAPLLLLKRTAAAPFATAQQQQKPQSAQSAQSAPPAAPPSVVAPPTPSPPVPELRVVEVYENQRWWAGREWTTQMQPRERPPWSDGLGNAVQRPLVTKEPPRKPGWEWVDSVWFIDQDWAPTDDEGWVYCDTNWSASSASASAGATLVTRQRRWIRRMVLAATAAHLFSSSSSSSSSASSSLSPSPSATSPTSSLVVPPPPYSSLLLRPSAAPSLSSLVSDQASSSSYPPSAAASSLARRLGFGGGGGGTASRPSPVGAAPDAPALRHRTAAGRQVAD